MVDLAPGEDAGDLQIEIRDGKRCLPKRPDGACIYLGDTGCTIYEKRPQACRAFDCRVSP